MIADSHPEYQIEAKKLVDTLETLQNRISSMTPPDPGYGADQRAAVAVLRKKQESLELLKQARNDPYFGRVDWLESKDAQHETFYVGKIAVPELGIFSWRGTLPARLYYTGGKYRDKLLLKRTFVIQSDELAQIADDFVAPSRAALVPVPADVPPDVKAGDALLIQLLTQSRTGKLHEIVATIQEEQFDLIQSPREQVLVVQGVPGSGKTAIALHRLSYLLFSREDEPGFEQARVIYLGPNPLFLKYVESVLPELGERGVPQRAFDEWMLQQTGQNFEYEPEEDALEALLDTELPFALRAMRFRNARHKGSLNMARLLDRYVEERLNQILADLGDFAIALPSPATRRSQQSLPKIDFTLPNSSVRELALQLRGDETSGVPLNQLKATLTARLQQQVSLELRSKMQDQKRARLDDDAINQLNQSVAQAIDAYLRPWQALNLANAYRSLMRSSDTLHRLGTDFFDPWSLELLHLDAPKQGTPFRFSDLGALVYLGSLLDSVPPERTFDHIVIDEAQDMTPLQFEVLRRYSRNQSFTILGDLAQSVYSDHGLHSWDELKDIFGTERLTLHTIQLSYRSTEPIIEYANHVLTRSQAPTSFLAQPLARSGPVPTEQGFSDVGARAEAIVKLANDARQNGHRSIAVITKSARLAQLLESELRAVAEPTWQLIDRRDVPYAGGWAILPAYLAKGLEFDTVIIADADATTYPATTLDARLLYVALTRASHRLHVCWVGDISPLLTPNDDRLPIEDFYRARLEPELTTVAQFAQPEGVTLSADTLVERLAGAGKLPLLHQGKIDAIVLAVLSASWTTPSTTDEENVPALQPHLQADIERKIAAQLKTHSSPAHPTLVLIQVCFGLLRNVLRATGLELAEDQTRDIYAQAGVLARFAYAVADHGMTYTVGPHTTPRRMLDYVEDHWAHEAETELFTLIEHGLVETAEYNQGKRIRVAYDWIESLVRLALDLDAPQVDPDLRNALLTRTTSPFVQVAS